MTLSRGCRRSTAAFLLLAACGHTDPFTNPDVTNDGPFSATAPVRLTYNVGSDRTPAVSADGRVLYAFTAPEIPGGDQCLARLPLAGGTRTEYCPRSAGARDSTDRLEEPAWVDSATLAYVRAAKPIGADRDSYLALGTAPLADPVAFTPRLGFPFVAPSGHAHEGATRLVPLDDGRVAYVAMVRLSYVCGDKCVIIDTVGREVGIVELAGSAPPAIVPGTDYVTGLSAGEAPGELVYTLVGDSRAYRRTADGTVTVLHDFGDVARDVQLRAGRLAAVVGGAVSLLTSDTGEPMQVDGGGTLVVVDLATGTVPTGPSPDAPVERPALAADGRSVVVQTAAGQADLYRVEVP